MYEVVLSTKIKLGARLVQTANKNIKIPLRTKELLLQHINLITD